MTRFFDSRGQHVSVAQQPFAVGGEGKIYDIAGNPAVVAKIYSAPQSPERSEKLRIMTGLAAPDLLKIAAWPTSTLHAAPGGPIAGILMPKISGFKEIHHLYSVAQRKKDYPGADWGFLIHAARNCAIAFEAIHRRGQVIGDVNQKNILVSERAIVQFVDCDSFQIRSDCGKLFRCAVGVPEFTPPELQGRSFRDIDRDADHDLFGLAILIFHLLMMGRHPFSGVSLDPGEMPPRKGDPRGAVCLRAKSGRDADEATPPDPADHGHRSLRHELVRAGLLPIGSSTAAREADRIRVEGRPCWAGEPVEALPSG